MFSLAQQYGIDIISFLLVPFCLLPIVWFVVGLLFGIWVYRDAERRGMDGVLWLIVVLIGGIIGLIIYLVVRKPEVNTGAAPPSSYTPATKYCIQCGSPLPYDARFCPKCGREQK